MADLLQLLVRFLHLFFGLSWVGGWVFLGHLLVQMERKGEGEIRSRAPPFVLRRAITFFTASGVATILLGLGNQFLIEGRLDFESDLWNVLLGASFFLSLFMIVLHLLWISPFLERIEKGVSEEERGSIWKRAQRGVWIEVGVGTLTLFLMVAAVSRRLAIL